MKGTLKTLLADALERARASGELELVAAEIPEIGVEVPREQGRGEDSGGVTGRCGHVRL